ncbi:hypothetical protein JOC36_000932 [Weissella uvarum]|uniref:hypothetical protein n=1 Tax=Weissella uvarum TaxID=1479233 RepID=UPI0019611CDC|nr:hypothetical protein [Weissella uvarum]MBM7617375.1 hypothetical protein [Weissella uvarum]MCM0595738.1 hypothetical protein [Weissella uvarum]
MDKVIQNIDSFKLYHESTGVTDFNANSTYFIGDLLWSLVTLIYSGMDSLINILFNADSMNGLISWVTAISKALYSGISGVVLNTFFALGAIASVFFYVTKGKTAAYKQLIQIFCILLVSSIWFLNVGPILTSINSVSDSLGTTVASSISRSFDSSNSKKTNYTDLISDDKSKTTKSVTAVRRDYFDNSIYKLWQIGKFGDAETSKNAQAHFLKDKPLSAKDVDKIKGNKDVTPYKKYLEKENANQKSSTAFAGIIVIILNGLSYIGIGLINWVVTLIATLTLSIPILAILSYFPRFNRSLYNGIFKIITAFFTKAIVVILIVVVNLSNTITTTLVSILNGSFKGSSAIGLTLVASVLQFVLLYLLWRNRGHIMSAVSGGQITNVPYADGMAHSIRNGTEFISTHTPTFVEAKNGFYGGLDRVHEDGENEVQHVAEETNDEEQNEVPDNLESTDLINNNHQNNSSDET